MPRGRFRMRGYRDAGQLQITDHVRHAAIEKHRPARVPRKIVRAHLPAQHQLRERGAIVPWQRGAADRHLIADHAAPGFGGTREARLFECVEQRALARTGPARDDEKTIERIAVRRAPGGAGRARVLTHARCAGPHAA